MDQPRKIVLARVGASLVGLVALAFLAVIVFSIFTTQMGSMVFALLMGGVGAVVSTIKRLPSYREAELGFLITSWWTILVPVLVGVVMGGLIYVVFLAEILTGDGGGGLFTSNLFPNFTDPIVDAEGNHLLNIRAILTIRPVTFQDFGKLLVWCFLSGYSERLMPSLLESLEKRGSTAKE